MAYKCIVLSFLPLAASATNLLARTYEDEVCHPAVKSGDTIPPCISVESIEASCKPQKEEPIYYAASQQCMCKGSYFSDWPGCQSCLFEHGLRSERDVAQYDLILSAASSAFCDPSATPTDVFAQYWTSASYTVPVPTTGATVKSDRAPGETAVSLYYTATVSQGPGTVTGSAASVVSTPAQAESTTGGSSAETTGLAGGGSITSGTGRAGTTAGTTTTHSSTNRLSSASSTVSTSTTASGNAGARGTGMPALGDALLWGVGVGAALVL